MLLLVLASALAAEPCDPEVSAELASLHGQSDATKSVLEQRRLASQVAEIDESGSICSAEDAFHAASVLRHGTVLDVDRARPLAERARAGEVKGADFLAVRIDDRWHVNRGLAQPFGTAWSVKGQTHCIWPIDPSVSDEERRSRAAKRIEDSYALAASRNGLEGVEPTEAGLSEAGLFCDPLDYEAEVARLALEAPTKAHSKTTSKEAGGLAVGELYGTRNGWTGNAFTVGKGRLALHLINRSSYGLSDRVDVKLSLLGMVAGPNLGLEFAPLQSDAVHLSLEAYGHLSWFGGLFDAGGAFHLSTPFNGGMVTLSTSGGGVPGGEFVNGVFVPRLTPYVRPELTLEVYIGGRGALVVDARGDVVQVPDVGASAMAFSLIYAHTFEYVGFSLGAVVVDFDPATIPDGLWESFPGTPPSGWLPMPHAQLWSRF